MKSRALDASDLQRLEELHYKFYPEFQFPSFLRMLNAFVIENDEGKLIMAGAVEHVGEIVLVTDKEQKLATIGRALMEAKAISEFTAMHFGIKELYAFVNNDDYAKHLVKHGFSKHPFQALSLRIK